MKRNSLLLLLAVFVLLVFSAADAAWVLNGGPPCVGCSDNDANDLIVEGASNFLQSYSQFFLLLNESELSAKSEIDSLKAEALVLAALNKIKKSKEYYASAFQCGENTSYNLTTIESLKNFDYDGLVALRKLNPCIMENVSGFLSKGDLTGFYNKVFSDMDKIIVKLSFVHDVVGKGSMPGIEVLRELYQDFNDFMTLGYYSSIVFSEIGE